MGNGDTQHPLLFLMTDWLLDIECGYFKILIGSDTDPSLGKDRHVLVYVRYEFSYSYY